MNILILLADLRYPGGITQYNLKLIRALKDLGATVTLVERKQGGVFAKIGLVAAFIRTILLRRPEAIVCTNLHFAPLALYAKKLFGVPYTTTVYGIEVIGIASAAYREALREARRIVKLFDQAERDVVRQIPEAAGKFLRIPNSVDGERFVIGERPEALLRRYGLMKEAKIMLTIARITKEDGDNKGYERVLRALPLVLARVPEARYMLAGEGNDLPRMKQLAAELGLADRVVFPGAIAAAELPAHYQLADVFVLPSKNEGFPPIVLLEALSAGVPVVGGAQPDALLPLWQEELGLIVPPDDGDAIAGALATILSGRAPRHFYDREGLRARVLQEYGPEGHRAAVAKVLDALREP